MCHSFSMLLLRTFLYPYIYMIHYCFVLQCICREFFIVLGLHGAQPPCSRCMCLLSWWILCCQGGSELWVYRPILCIIHIYPANSLVPFMASTDIRTKIVGIYSTYRGTTIWKESTDAKIVVITQHFSTFKNISTAHVLSSLDSFILDVHIVNAN